MNKEHAIALVATGWWKDKTSRQICMFQMFEDRLCMPFDEFHKAVEVALGRSVWTHEFGVNRDGLQAELLGTGKAPTMDEIFEMIPEAKRIILTV